MTFTGFGPAALTASALYERHEGKAQGQKRHADVLGASLKVPADAALGGMTVTPYAGWRVIDVDHADAEDRVVVHEFPVGFRAKGSFDAGAWKLSPVVDAAFVPQAGDTKVRLAGTNTQSVISGDYAVTYRAGLTTEKGGLAFGFNYSGATGDSGLRSHSVQATVRLAF